MNQKHKQNISCDSKCKFAGRKCNSNQNWNYDKCRCVCKNSKNTSCIQRKLRLEF